MSVIQDGKLMAFNVIQQVMNDFMMVACPAHRTDLPPGASEATPERSPGIPCAAQVPVPRLPADLGFVKRRGTCYSGNG